MVSRICRFIFLRHDIGYRQIILPFYLVIWTALCSKVGNWIQLFYIIKPVLLSTLSTFLQVNLYQLSPQYPHDQSGDTWLVASKHKQEKWPSWLADIAADFKRISLTFGLTYGRIVMNSLLTFYESHYITMQNDVACTVWPKVCGHPSITSICEWYRVYNHLCFVCVMFFIHELACVPVIIDFRGGSNLPSGWVIKALTMNKAPQNTSSTVVYPISVESLLIK